MLSQASRSSVTIWEETAPVKLTRRHCPPSGLQSGVRILISEEWCFTLRLCGNRGPRFEVSHLRYASLTRCLNLSALVTCHTLYVVLTTWQSAVFLLNSR